MQTPPHPAHDPFALVKTPLGLAGLTWAMLVGLDLILGGGIPVAPQGSSHFIFWWLLANAITAATLGFLASRAPWSGARLALALAAVPLAIQVINVIEAIAYLKLDQGVSWTLLLSPAKYLFIFPLWLALDRQPAVRSPAGRSLTAAGMIWRLMVSILAYVMLYFIAGILILPLVQDFYATQTMPPVGVIAALQLLLRGPVFTATCVLLARLIGGPGWTTGLLAGLAFAAVSGIAPLILPSPFFPDAVRRVHFCEVTAANFVFGTFVALLWRGGSSSQASRQPRDI